MPLYLEVHTVEGVSAADVADAHMKDVETQPDRGTAPSEGPLDAAPRRTR
jgi:hypothetical protein